MITYISKTLESIQLDIKQQRFICTDGTLLSGAELTQHIHQDDLTMSADDIDLCITEWLT